jgi:hypothetical protein
MRTIAAGVAVLVLAGCQSVVISATSYDVLFRAGVPSEFGYAASGGEMPVFVVGNPFPMEQARVAQAVVDAMQGKNSGPNVRFVNGPAQGARPGYGVVMVLGAAPGTPAEAACSPERRLLMAPVPAADQLTLLAVFCGGNDARSWAWSRAPRFAPPGDPLFAQLVAQTTYLMLPPRDDDWGDSDFL